MSHVVQHKQKISEMRLFAKLIASVKHCKFLHPFQNAVLYAAAIQISCREQHHNNDRQLCCLYMFFTAVNSKTVRTD